MKKIMLLLLLATVALNVKAQNNRVVKGAVYDNADKKPLAGAKIWVNGSNVSTFSDKKGKYQIRLPAGKDSLSFSDTTRNNVPRVCYKTTTAGVGKASVLNIYLKQSVVYYVDTIYYDVAVYKFAHASTIDVLKKIQDFQFEGNEMVSQMGESIAKVELNGKPTNRTINEVIKRLKIDKLIGIQVIDDYGDTAQLTSIKTGAPKKIVNFILNKKLKAAFPKRVNMVNTINRFLFTTN